LLVDSLSLSIWIWMDVLEALWTLWRKKNH